MFDMLNMFKQAQQMQSSFKALEQKLAGIYADGEAAAGAVRVRINGRFEAVSIEIAPAVKQDKPGVMETLICSAFCDAAAVMRGKLRDEYAEAFGGALPEGMQLPL